MHLSIEKLIDGCMQTLREDVLPSVDDRFARGQLWAVLDVLQNLRDRVEEKASLHAAEATSAIAALECLEQVLREAGGASGADRLRALREEAPSEPAPARSAALRAALVGALELLHALPDGMPEAARAALRDHLGPQAVRDIALLKPSLLNEISKG